MQGKIVKGIAGFYYVNTPEGIQYECKARGLFRQERAKPLVGDNVVFEATPDEAFKGTITQICSRSSQLIRPAVANVDQAVILFACKDPNPNLNLLDRFLIMMEAQEIPCCIVFTKNDLVDSSVVTQLTNTYANTPYSVADICTKNKDDIRRIHALLKGKTTVIAGPSGVGKSTLVNALCPQAAMETGDVSKKIGRGKHTTRHSEVFQLDSTTFLLDTPGFTSLSPDMSPDMVSYENLKDYIPEFAEHEKNCKFVGCVHVGEKICGVKDAVKQTLIHPSRYENYLQLYNELKEKKRF